jgi:hypothetical protein
VEITCVRRLDTLVVGHVDVDAILGHGNIVAWCVNVEKMTGAASVGDGCGLGFR